MSSAIAVCLRHTAIGFQTNVVAAKTQAAVRLPKRQQATVLKQRKDMAMNFLPEMSEIGKIAAEGKYRVLPVSCEILSDICTPSKRWIF